jgi:hypothetical protein
LSQVGLATVPSKDGQTSGARKRLSLIDASGINDVTADEAHSSTTLVESEEAVAPVAPVAPVVEALIGSEEEQDYALVTLAVPCSTCEEPTNTNTSLDPQRARQYHSFMAAHYAQASLRDRGKPCQDYFKKDALKENVFFVSGFSTQVHEHCLFLWLNNAPH